MISQKKYTLLALLGLVLSVSVCSSWPTADKDDEQDEIFHDARDQFDDDDVHNLDDHLDHKQLFHKDRDDSHELEENASSKKSYQEPLADGAPTRLVPLVDSSKHNEEDDIFHDAHTDFIGQNDEPEESDEGHGQFGGHSFEELPRPHEGDDYLRDSNYHEDQEELESLGHSDDHESIPHEDSPPFVDSHWTRLASANDGLTEGESSNQVSEHESQSQPRDASPSVGGNEEQECQRMEENLDSEIERVRSGDHSIFEDEHQVEGTEEGQKHLPESVHEDEEEAQPEHEGKPEPAKSNSASDGNRPVPDELEVPAPDAPKPAQPTQSPTVNQVEQPAASTVTPPTHPQPIPAPNPAPISNPTPQVDSHPPQPAKPVGKKGRGKALIKKVKCLFSRSCKRSSVNE